MLVFVLIQRKAKPVRFNSSIHIVYYYNPASFAFIFKLHNYRQTIIFA